MSAKGGGSLATFLFSIPLAAIPLMAIFGIPQFAPVVAGPDSGAADEENGYRSRASDLLRPYEDRELSQPLSDAPAYDGGGVDLGEPGGAYRDSNGSQLRRPEGFPEESQHGDAAPFDGASGPDAIAGHTAESHNPWSDDSSLVGSVEPESTSSPPVTTSLTWREASRQLAEMGIEDYHLERGGADGSFLFVCSFAPAGAAHVTMRFEAESNDPLLAVADVLGQVDRWLRQRYAQSRDADAAPAP
jgi:hypothetical protein